MSSLAKQATLHHHGSHSVEASSKTPEGTSREEVFLYFDAVWRGQPVTVTMRADRYAASYHDATGTSTDRLTPWRTYATEARYGSSAERGNEHVTGTARSALSELCTPLVMEWLDSDAYTDSFQRSVARMVMRCFDDEYSGMRRVAEALVKFDAVLPPEISTAITAARDTYLVYAQCKQAAYAVVSGGN